jgi:polysaccharide pyruvyl transferase WcaK-like protein
MKIAYFINTFKSINWGGQATSSGIQYMLEQAYPQAQFVPVDLPELPFKKIKIFRKYYESKMVTAIMQDDISALKYILHKMNIPESIFDDFTHICFNGEGAVHYKSGHIRVFMGLLVLAKHKGKYVAAINQTVDLNSEKILEALIGKVYNTLDFVSVREPLSYEAVQKMGINSVKLIPDAVYGLPYINNDEISRIIQSYDLPEKYLTFTGSSALKRNRKSLEQVQSILDTLKKYVNLPIVFMANAKTDIWLAHKLQHKYGFSIIEPPVKYKDAMAIIAGSQILVGGRQHPNIFAYIYHVPYVPLEGNTFKNSGVALLQKYPLVPLPWDTTEKKLIEAIQRVEDKKDIFNQIEIKDFNIFG